MMPHLTVVILSAVAGLFVVILLISLLSLRIGIRQRNTLQQVAERRGLTWVKSGLFGPGEVEGTVDDFDVDIFPHTQGFGSFQRQLTVVEVPLHPPLTTVFKIGRENLFSRLARAGGVHDIEFGDPTFDDVYRVSGPHPERIEALFDEASRAACVLLAREASDLKIEPKRIRWERSGRVFDVELLERTIEVAVLTAAALRHSDQRILRSR